MPIKDQEKLRAYRRRYDLKRFHERMRQAREILGGRCNHCGSRRQLQIDHVDPALKTLELGSVWGVSKARFARELKKCQLLCAKCHKRKTAREQRQGHGTWGMYRNRKCRCVICRTFVAAYQRKRRQRLGS